MNKKYITQVADLYAWFLHHNMKGVAASFITKIVTQDDTNSILQRYQDAADSAGYKDNWNE